MRNHLLSFATIFLFIQSAFAQLVDTPPYSVNHQTGVQSIIIYVNKEASFVNTHQTRLLTEEEVESVRTRANNEIRDYLRQESLGYTDVTFTVFPYLIAGKYEWGNVKELQAAAAELVPGWDDSAFDRVWIHNGRGGGGRASLGGRIIEGAPYAFPGRHELGHTYGVKHPITFRTESFPAPFRIRWGWYSNNDPDGLQYQEIISNGTYRVYNEYQTGSKKKPGTNRAYRLLGRYISFYKGVQKKPEGGTLDKNERLVVYKSGAGGTSNEQVDAILKVGESFVWEYSSSPVTVTATGYGTDSESQLEYMDFTVQTNADFGTNSQPWLSFRNIPSKQVVNTTQEFILIANDKDGEVVSVELKIDGKVIDPISPMSLLRYTASYPFSWLYSGYGVRYSYTPTSLGEKEVNVKITDNTGNVRERSYSAIDVVGKSEEYPYALALSVAANGGTIKTWDPVTINFSATTADPEASKLRQQHVYFNDERITLYTRDSSVEVIPTQVGTNTIKYVVLDYQGRLYEKSTTFNVVKNNLPAPVVDYEDALANVSAPQTVTAGQTYDIELNYSSSTNRDIVVTFSEKNEPYTTYHAEPGRVTVSRGTGKLTIPVTIAANTPKASGKYQWQVLITEVGKGYNEQKDQEDIRNVSVKESVDGSEVTETTDSTDQYYVLKNRDSGLNMRSQDCATASRTLVELFDGSGDCAQWQIIDAGNGYVHLKNRHSGLNLRNNDCDTTAGTTLELWSGTGTCAQWQIIDAGNGYVHLNNRNSGLNARNDGCENVNDETLVELVKWTGNCTQWQLIPVGNTRTADNDKKAVSIPTVADASEEVLVYPNPAQDQLHVRLPIYEGETIITLTDLMGRQVLRHRQVGSQLINLSVQDLSKGLYQVSVRQAQQHTMHRLLIE